MTNECGIIEFHIHLILKDYYLFFEYLDFPCPFMLFSSFLHVCDHLSYSCTPFFIFTNQSGLVLRTLASAVYRLDVIPSPLISPFICSVTS